MAISYSKIGEYHREKGVCNQDCVLSNENESFYFFALADGVSSRKKSSDGAKIACDVVARMFMREDRLLLDYDIKSAWSVMLNEILFQIKKAAADSDCDVREYASTLMFALIDKMKQEIIICNLGDGMCVATFDKNSFVVARPCERSDGCFVTTTENAVSTVSVYKTSIYKLDSVLLMTDGAWGLMFEDGKLKDSYKNDIIHTNANGLIEKCESQVNSDDCSFIFVDLMQMRLNGEL